MRRAAAIAILTGALALAAAPAASALGGTGATEFGNPCVGDTVIPGATAIGLNRSAGPWELRDGGPGAVITRWKGQLGSGLGPLPQQLVAFKQMEGGDQLVGESAVEVLVDGTNEFQTRIPIPEYAHIGLRGPGTALLCNNSPGEFAGTVDGPFATGEVREYKVLVNKGVPAIAIAERDEDGDGYGDLTQDKCTISAEFHDPCPSFVIAGRVEAVETGAILLAVTANMSTRIHVYGQVSWPSTPKRKPASPASKDSPKRTSVNLDGGIQQATAGVPTVFRVPLPKAAIRRLHKTRPDRNLGAMLLMARLDRLQELPGQVTSSVGVKIPGRERRRRRGSSSGQNRANPGNFEAPERPPTAATLPG